MYFPLIFDSVLSCRSPLQELSNHFTVGNKEIFPVLPSVSRQRNGSLLGARAVDISFHVADADVIQIRNGCMTCRPPSAASVYSNASF